MERSPEEQETNARIYSSPLNCTLGELLAEAKRLGAGKVELKIGGDENPTAALVLLLEDVGEYLGAIAATEERLEARDASAD